MKFFEGEFHIFYSLQRDLVDFSKIEYIMYKLPLNNIIEITYFINNMISFLFNFVNFNLGTSCAFLQRNANPGGGSSARVAGECVFFSEVFPLSLIRTGSSQGPGSGQSKSHRRDPW